MKVTLGSVDFGCPCNMEVSYAGISGDKLNIRLVTDDKSLAISLLSEDLLAALHTVIACGNRHKSRVTVGAKEAKNVE